MTYKVQSDVAETTKEAASTKAGAEEMKCLSPSSYPELNFIPESSNWW